LPLIVQAERKDTAVISQQQAQQYFCFSSQRGIVSVVVRDFAEDTSRSNLSFDNVSRSALVADPSGLILILGGGGFVGI
jgi:hypothetical protein